MSDSGRRGGRKAWRRSTSFRSFSARSAREALSNSAAASVCGLNLREGSLMKNGEGDEGGCAYSSGDGLSEDGDYCG